MLVNKTAAGMPTRSAVPQKLFSHIKLVQYDKKPLTLDFLKALLSWFAAHNKRRLQND